MFHHMGTQHNKVYKLLVTRRNIKDPPGDSRLSAVVTF